MESMDYLVIFVIIVLVAKVLIPDPLEFIDPFLLPIIAYLMADITGII